MGAVQFHANSNRLIIGKTYFFEDIGEKGLTATVTSATVNELEKFIYFATDKGHILTQPISDEELEDYQKHPNTFFGIIHEQSRNIKDPFELFERMLNTYINTPKEKLLELMKEYPDIIQLTSLSQKELALIYCEGCVHAMMQKHEQAT